MASVGAITFWIFRPRTITLLTLMTRIPMLTSAIPTHQHSPASCDSQLLENSLAPEAPRSEVFEPGLTTYPSAAEEVSVPEMMTIFFALPATAASRAASVVTVVTVPPEPPVVPVFTVAH